MAKPKTKKKKAARKKTIAKRKKVEAVPSRYSTVTPYFQVPKCKDAIVFLQQVFGAKVMDRYDGPKGEVFHCELKIGNVVLMCGDAERETRSLGAGVYVKNVDQVFDKAVALGAKVKEPLETKFYGDRSGRVVDPWGNEWSIATHVEDVSKKEMQKRMAAMPQGGGQNAA